MKVLNQLSKIFLIITILFFAGCDNQAIDSDIDPNAIDPNCTVPTAFQASDFIEGSDVNLSWVVTEGQLAWEIQYGLEGFILGSGTTTLSASPFYTVQGLDDSNNYDFYVRTICSSTSFSTWVGPISVDSVIGGIDCLVPTDFIAVRESTNGTIVNLSWVAGGDELKWDIQYGDAGFELGSGLTINSNFNTKQVSNLIVNQAYDFYVRAKCSTNNFSDWIGPITVEAGPDPIVPPLYMSAKIDGTTYPDMRPTQYNFTGIKAKLDSSVDAAMGKVLLIQGNPIPLNTPPNNFTEITLRIHQDFWLPETYVLNQYGTTLPAVTVNLVITNPTNNYEEFELPGILTITEFNAETKRIKGTFSFSYNLKTIPTTPNGTSTIVGSVKNVTNGTFDFEVEDSVFN